MSSYDRIAMLVIVAACGQPPSPAQPVEPPPGPMPTRTTASSESAPDPAPSSQPTQAGIPPEHSTTHIPMFPGAWSITRTLSLGSAHQQTTPATTTECLTRAQMLPDPAPGMPMGSRCTSSFEVNGRDLDWSFTCTADIATVKARGPLRFTGKAFSGTIKVEMTTTDGASTSGSRGLLKISGQHTGDCAK